MANKPHFDLETARRLRVLGWNYQDIAHYMGCSEDWCKKNLAGIKKNYELMRKIADWQLKYNKDPEMFKQLAEELG